MVNPWHLEVCVLSAEEFHGLKAWSSQCKAHVPWLVLPAPLGIPALAQTHSSEPRWFFPSERGRNVLLEAASLLISCCSSCRPFAGQLIELRLLFPASEPSPVPFLLASLSACSFLLHYSHPAPLSAALEQPFPLRVQMSPSSSASRAAVPARCGGGRWDMGYSPLPHVPPFPGPAPQPAFVTEAGLSAGDCESLVAVACSPLCIVRTERADGIQQITVRDCGNVQIGRAHV